MPTAAPSSEARSDPFSFEACDAPLSTPHSLARALTLRRPEYLGQRQIRIKLGCWNTASCPGTDKDVCSWFFNQHGIDSHFSKLAVSSQITEPAGGTDKNDFGLYVLGLQEVVDLNTAKQYMSRVYTESNSQISKWRTALEAGLPAGYELIAAEQMVGLLTLIYASTEVAKHITNISSQQIGTGLLGYFGNKGAIATRIVFGETTRIVFVNSHLASGVGSSYLDRRCWDAAQIASRIQFEAVVNNGVAEDAGDKLGDEDFAFWLGDLNFRLGGLPGDDIRRILTLHTRGEFDLMTDKPPKPLDDEPVFVIKDSESDDETATASSLHSRERSFDSATSLPDPDDFLDDPSQDPTSLQATLDSLLPHDQLRQVISNRKAFHDGWREGPITFLPTYKYDLGSVSLFDTSEKQRAPSWCDRILYRTREYKQEYDKRRLDEAESHKKDEEMKSRGIETDEDILFNYNPDEDGDDQDQETDPDQDQGQEPEPLVNTSYGYDEYNEDEDEPGEPEPAAIDRIQLEFYNSYQRVTSSDHKPLKAVFTLDCICVIPEEKAKIHSEVAKQLDRAENEGRPVLTLVSEGNATQSADVVDMGELSFLSKSTNSITIANTGGVDASFYFVKGPGMDEGDEGSSSSEWLTSTFIKPDGSKEQAGSRVTLEPGETATAVLEGQVSTIPFLRALNNGKATLEDVVILRVENGRDHFITVRSQWLPSCFGRSLDELIRVPEGGIRKFVREKEIRGSILNDSDVHCSAPRELFKLTEAIQTLAERCVADVHMLEDMLLPRNAGWPFDGEIGTMSREEKEKIKAGVIDMLDRDGSIMEALPVEIPSSHKLELLSSVLLLFLASLTDGLVTGPMCTKLFSSIPSLPGLASSGWAETKVKVLDVLSSAPNHNIAFTFLTATLAQVARELIAATGETRKEGLQRRLSFRRGEADGGVRRRRAARERRYAEVVAPVAFRGGGEKERREQERALLELLLSLEMQD